MAKNLIFILAYNHEKFIEKVVARIPESVILNPENEVLIIDDASKDSTFYVSDTVSEKYKGKAKITVLKNPVNQGYGGNQKLGYRYAIDNGFDRVFMVHGDGQYAPELLGDLIAEYDSEKKPDAVFGTRMYSIKSARKGGMPIYKIIGNTILTKIQNRILKSNMSEFHSGYRSYSINLLKRIPFEKNSNDFHFDTEIIIQCLAANAKIVEIPIPTHYGDEICHVNGVDYALNVLFAVIHYRIQQLGFLYDRKFDVLPYQRPAKLTPYSSHTQIVNMVAPFTRVLDVTCGKGHIAKRLIEKGCIVDGVDSLDPSKVEANFRNYFHMNIIEEPDQLKNIFQKNEYDFIILGDLLERVSKPDHVLDLIRSQHKVRPRPVIIALCSNVGFFITRLMLTIGQFNYGTRGILDKHHIRLYTKKSLMRLFQQSSYIIRNVNSVPLSFTSIFGAKSKLAYSLESIHHWFAKNLSGFFSYQYIISSEPLPTTNQILEICGEYSEELRTSDSKSEAKLYLAVPKENQ